MNLKALENKTILLFGKSRAFSEDEFDSQMKFHKINLVKEYVQDVVLIVEGKMMTPYEQDKSDALYEDKKAEFVSIDALELELAKYIDEDTLLMSLKLSRDKERLKGFLQNTTLSNELFLKLLKMYAWGDEDFFENNDNRDVSAALVVRFYENIERNHNVQYAALGLMHLISQCKDEKLIEAVSMLEPLQKSFKSDSKDANYSIITSIATHHFTPKNVLHLLIKKSNAYVRVLIAMRKDCDAIMQQELYDTKDEKVYEALSHNANLDKNIMRQLIKNKKYAINMAKHLHLNAEIFEMFVKEYAKELAENESISCEMQERLFSFENEEVMLALASNTHLSENVAMELLCTGNEEISFALYANSATPRESLEQAYENKLNHISLAYNENTPPHILKLLAESEDAKVLQGLAKNQKTPVEILYQLQLDGRFERAVKENPAFGKHIQSENIGWQV
ncbi:hypothetical protein KKG72_05475 [bacterium]|nr:hypothetical protein [bacterium]MBU1993550.1 hypothetical protein [bacterium]